MRQEPIVYIKGLPYVAKERLMPYNNLEYPGISPEGLTAVEATLKAEVLAEAAAHGDRVLLHGERDVTPAAGTGRVLAAWGEVYAFWEPIGPNDVLTPDEAFGEATKLAQVQPSSIIPQPKRLTYSR